MAAAIFWDIGVGGSKDKSVCDSLKTLPIKNPILTYGPGDYKTLQNIC